MTAFWIIACLLLAGALLFVLPPLLRPGSAGPAAQTVTVSVYRNQMMELEADFLAGSILKDQFHSGKEELERRLLDEVTLVKDSAPASFVESRGKVATAALVALALPICAFLIYFALGHPEAIAPDKEATAHAVTPDQIMIMVERLAVRLKDNPNDVDGWRLLARSYATVGRFREAADAYAMGGQDMPETKSAATSDASTSAARSAAITGAVSLSPAVAAKAAPTDTVFIFARAASGPKMPLAIVRVQVKDLPKAFILDDATSMGPAMKLSNFQEVMVSARVSKTGNAAPQSGDLLGSIGPVKIGSRELNIVIDRVAP